jgi:ParB family chromosome partitioning protein
MANFNRTEEARRNRMAAMVDDGETDAAADRGADPFEGRKQLREACSLRLDKIIADPDQPRKDFDEEPLGRLAESIKARGQLQPIRVRWDQGRGVYVVVVGERRWRAARLAGLETLSCIVVSGTPTPAEILEDQLVENAIREGLKPVEQARAFRTLMDGLHLTQQQLAAKLQISQTTVSQSLSLLDLAATAQARVDSGELAPSVAYQIAKVEDAETQRDLAERIVSEKLSRAEAVEAVRRESKAKPKGRGAAKSKGKPTRLPAELKHRGPNGCRVTVQTAARHTLADVLADVEAFAEKLRLQLMETSQEAA